MADVSQEENCHSKAHLNFISSLWFCRNLTFGWEGPSWRLLTALKVLSLGAEEL